ncbi:MAG: hypothetical protein NTV51_11200 [Verrucomicrobia bacterium]|nr:hypothetical protein [Verrucomicrobiota bacterium]
MKTLTLLLATLLFLTAGCSRRPSLVGTWRTNASGYTARFILRLDAQGKGSLREASMPASAKNEITWREDGDSVRISKSWRYPDNFKIVTLTETELVLVGPDHVALTFTRIDD